MPGALTVFAVISIIIIGVLLVVQMFVVTALLLAVKNLMADLRERVDPLVSKAETLLSTANTMAETVQDRTERIADQAAQTTDSLGAGVAMTSRVVQQLIAMPMVRGSAVMAGLRSGLATWRTLRRDRKIPPSGI